LSNPFDLNNFTKASYGRIMKEVQVNDKNVYSLREEKGKIFLNDLEIQPDFQKKGGQTWHVLLNDEGFRISVLKVNPEENEVLLSINGKRAKVKVTSEMDRLLKRLGMAGTGAKKAAFLNAPMPGMIYSIRTQEGETVKKGDPVLILEAMKMENVIKSPSDAKIKKIHVKPGVSVEKGQLLVTFE
jgi:biotin carboxyl carrier protein